MRVCAALASDPGTPILEATVIPDPTMSAAAIAAVITDGYGRGPEHRAADAASARRTALSALGEEARGIEEHIAGLAQAHLCPLVPDGKSYTIRIESDHAEVVAG